MNEKLEIIGRTVKKKGHSAVKIIKTETENYLLGRCDATIALPKVKEYLGIE